jgi:hypothetical protein
VTQSDDYVTTPQRFQRRAGMPLEMAAPDVHAQLTVPYYTADRTLKVERYTQAQCLLVTKPYPRGDSDIDLLVEPTIAAGETKPRVAPGDGNTLIQVWSQERIAYGELRFSVRLSPGECLLLTSTDQPKGLGEVFFTEGGETQPRKRFVVVRVAQTHQDDRFPLGSQSL